MKLFLVFVVLASASGLTQSGTADLSVWGPADSVHALDSVIAAVNGLVNSSHLSADNLKRGMAVAEEIKSDIEAVEKGKLTKKDARQKVGTAMKELTSFQNKLQDEKLAIVGKMLDQHREKIDKITEEAKVMKFKMDLSEKKDKAEKELEQKRRDDLVKSYHNSNVNKTAHTVTVAVHSVEKVEKNNASKETETPLPASIQAVLDTVEVQDRKVEKILADITAEEKKSNKDADAAIKMQVPTSGKDDAISKAQSVLKLVKEQANRKLEKKRAVKEVELKDLKDAEASIKKKDISTLQKILAKMEREKKAMETKSGGFLH